MSAVAQCPQASRASSSLEMLIGIPSGEVGAIFIVATTEDFVKLFRIQGLLQNAVEVHIVENSLLNKLVIHKFVLGKPMRDLLSGFFNCS